jgi:hypothetical protein
MGNSERKEPLGKPRLRLEDNIEEILEKEDSSVG